MTDGLRELSLFSGAGGWLLATKWLLGWECRGYVEWNPFRQRILRQRILDGIFDNAEIYGDIRAFVAEGYARTYRGQVDVVTAGSPCTPFSFAGKRLGVQDPRNMWPATAATIREVRPRFVFLENVPGLLSGTKVQVAVDWIDPQRFLFGNKWQTTRTVLGLPSYFGRVLQDLAALGYDARWGCVSANNLGAPHKRLRLWLVAHAKDVLCNDGDNNTRECVEEGAVSESGNRCGQEDIPDSKHIGRPTRTERTRREEGSDTCGRSAGAGVGDSEKRDGRDVGEDFREVCGEIDSLEYSSGAQRGNDRSGIGETLADTEIDEEGRLSLRTTSTESGLGGTGQDVADSNETGCAQQRRTESIGQAQRFLECGRRSGWRIPWWDIDPADIPDKDGNGRKGDAQPRLGRVAHGVADRVNRLEAIGDGVVPAVAAFAWLALSDGLLTSDGPTEIT